MKSAKFCDDSALGTARTDDLQWVHQLVHQPREIAADETPDLAALCALNALSEPHDPQIIALNLLSKGVAFGSYGAVLPLQDKLKILSGQYWNANPDTDMHRSPTRLN